MPTAVPTVAVFSLLVLTWGTRAVAAHDLAAASSVLAPGSAKAALASDCDSGIAYDDGDFESTIRSNSPHQSNLAMRFDPAGLERIDRVCLCWAISREQPGPLQHSLRVWAADAPGGRPGTLLGELPGLEVSGPGAPFPTITRAFYTYDLSSLALSFSSPVYIGPSWQTSSNTAYSICSDLGPDTPPQPSYIGDEPTGEPTPPTLHLGSSQLSIRALGIRAVTTLLGGSPFCTPDPTSLCLTNRRFRVEVAWHTNETSGVGTARTIPEVDSSGLFWFFEPSNLEFLVKVLDGCALNGHYWVFYAATTNVGFELKVTDSSDGTSRTYTNPLGQAAEPTQDIEAFRCEP